LTALHGQCELVGLEQWRIQDFSKEGAGCRRHRRIGVRWRGLGQTSPEINHFLVVKRYAWVQFDAVFNRQTTLTITRSLTTRIVRFSRESKLTKTAKIIQNSLSDWGRSTGHQVG